ncbi:MAG: DUF1450 domain-containing protein [Campylobacterales bacterium]|nr:DUF1450 domain-containing protein [Campylobacterales bacterium]
MKIKICKHYTNIKKFETNLTKAFPHDSIVIKGCIGMCKRCKDQLVAKVDGEKVKAKKIGKIIEKIEKL